MVSAKRTYGWLFVTAGVCGAATFFLLLAWFLQFRGGYTWWYDRDHLKMLFNWHPILITTGMVLINGAGIISIISVTLA